MSQSFFAYIDSYETSRLFSRSGKTVAFDKFVRMIENDVADNLDLDLARAYISLPISSNEDSKQQFADFLDHQPNTATLRLHYKESAVYTPRTPPTCAVLVATDAMRKFYHGARHFVFCVTSPQYEALFQELRAGGASVTLLRLEEQKIYPISMFRAIDRIIELDANDSFYLNDRSGDAD